MPLWGKNDANSNSCIFLPSQVNKTPNTANRNNMYGNTTVSAFVTKKVVGQFAASAAEMANTGGESKKLAHAGWQVRTVGSGPITEIAISTAGTGYSNDDLVAVAAPAGGVNAAATIETDGDGVITAITITDAGSGFVTVNPTVAITNSTGGTSAGSNASLTATAGGRAGRIHYECLVAMGTITGDGSDDTQLPE